MDYDEDTTLLAGELFEGESYVTLKSGGSAEICMEDEKANVKWTADGSKIVLTAADGDMEGSISDGILKLMVGGSWLYFAAENASTAGIHAITLDEMLYGVADDPGSREPGAETPAETAAPSGPSELQQQWNGWYFGCIDLDDCTGDWAFLNGQTFDTVMYVELDRAGTGRFAIYDPFGILVSNEHSNLYVQADCHADALYLYGDSGFAFNSDLNPSDWIFVHNSAIPEKLHVDSESSEANGDIGYSFQFKPWGDRWEDDPYTQFIPYFSSYLNALDAGLTCPFGDSFTGFGIAEPVDNGGGSTGTGTGAGSGSHSALLGSSPAVLDVNNKGAVYVYYPGDQFVYDSDYGKLKNAETGVGILIDPMLGANNLSELKASYEAHNSDEDDYSLTETTVNGYKALILTYSDWLGSTMRVDIDFGGAHGGFYGMSFAVSGDSLEDCNTDLVWAIIESMEVVK